MENPEDFVFTILNINEIANALNLKKKVVKGKNQQQRKFLS